MTPLTREWVAKAEADFATAGRELRARKFPNYDAACFHAQQCAEKYLKARLQESGIRFPHTHDLTVLLNLVVAAEPEWELLRNAAEALTDYAVRFRYPGSKAKKTQARQSVRFALLVREQARLALRIRSGATARKPRPQRRQQARR